MGGPCDHDGRGDGSDGVEGDGNAVDDADISRGGVGQEDMRAAVEVGVLADAAEAVDREVGLNFRSGGIFGDEDRLAHADSWQFERVLGREKAFEDGLKSAQGVQQHPSAKVENRIVIDGGIEMPILLLGIGAQEFRKTTKGVSVGNLEDTLLFRVDPDQIVFVAADFVLSGFQSLGQQLR